jgi:hypothetical protein
VPDKQLRVKANLCHRPGVKSKANTKFIERITKHPNGWDLLKELSQEWLKFMKLNRGLT